MTEVVKGQKAKQVTLKLRTDDKGSLVDAQATVKATAAQRPGQSDRKRLYSVEVRDDTTCASLEEVDFVAKPLVILSYPTPLEEEDDKGEEEPKEGDGKRPKKKMNKAGAYAQTVIVSLGITNLKGTVSRFRQPLNLAEWGGMKHWYRASRWFSKGFLFTLKQQVTP